MFVSPFTSLFFSYVQNFLENVLPLGQYTPLLNIPELAKLLKDGCSSRILRGKFRELQLVSFLSEILLQFKITIFCFNTF